MGVNPKHYLVLGEKLGAGGYASVHKARIGNHTFAAKKFYLNEDDHHQECIMNEATIHQKLRHRHIIQFYKTHEQDGHLYLLMELAEKGSLAQVIRNKSLGLDDWTTKRRLTSEIALGLEFIHQQGIIYRDLKSANVLLTKHMEVKLADFGLSKMRSLSQASMTGSRSGAKPAGTLRWMAPELMYATKPMYTTKSDVYALGVVMWEMAASCTKPYISQDSDDLIALLVKNGVRETFPEDTPTEYRLWAERCWQQDPMDRPEASEVVQIHLEPTRERTNIDESSIDFSFGHSSWADDWLKSHDAHQGLSEVKAVHHPSADQYVGRLPSMDDDVVEHMCMAATQGSVEAQLFLGWIYDHGRGIYKSDKDAFWWYRLAASHGTVVAQLRVAKMYDLGRGVDASDEKAAIWYLRAANGGSAEAQYRIGNMYEYGRGVKQDEEEALRWYRSAAFQGQSDAPYKLWTWYSLGRGVQQSDEKPLKWLVMAAQQGNISAQHSLGVAYAEGIGVEQNDVEAARLFTSAAQQGNASAQFRLGMVYAEGKGVEQSDVEAVKWLTKAADQGDASAQFRLGLMYAEGKGVEQSDVEAVKWLTNAAQQGNASAQFRLGLMYAEGKGVDGSDIEAVKWFTKAAEQGNVKAQVRLGLIYAEGKGVEQSDIEAVIWFDKAADQGDANAQFHLRMMCKGGFGVIESDAIEAAKWFTKAAEQGIINAQVRLGLIYAEGKGVEQSDIEAVMWFAKAADQGDASAQFNLGCMLQEGRGVEQSDSEALMWFMMAAEQGHQEAQFSLGCMFQEGRGAEQSDDEAVKWFTKAAEQGHGFSRKLLREMYQHVQQVEKGEVEVSQRPTNVGEHIGSGPYGFVHSAEKSGKSCVVKTLSLRHADFLRGDIEKEAAVLQTLVHEHITEFYGAEFAGPRIHLFAERVENGSLADQIVRTEMDWATKCRLGHEIAQGLLYIHNNGILHRSLKGTNVLLTRDLAAKICDFGLPTVRELKQLRPDVESTSGLRWMAPELLTVKPAFSIKSDMYAFGMVLWEMAARCTTPFKKMSDDITVMNLVKDQEREVLPADTPPAYASLVMSCWSHDPTERPKANQVQHLSGSLWLEVERDAQDGAIIDVDDYED
ncbi:hypothetical protein DFQ27_007864, partial [Actinomortierella ambigua]